MASASQRRNYFDPSSVKKELISSFVDRIAELTPQLVTFNASLFDLPVLRCRARVRIYGPIRALAAES
jgi:predicted PolB exonuclease-like 3'-5' exonuclease